MRTAEDARAAAAVAAAALDAATAAAASAQLRCSIWFSNNSGSRVRAVRAVGAGQDFRFIFLPVFGLLMAIMAASNACVFVVVVRGRG